MNEIEVIKIRSYNLPIQCIILYTLMNMRIIYYEYYGTYPFFFFLMTERVTSL